MTSEEVEWWLAYIAATDGERVAVIKGLLKYAIEDKMSVEDREICVRCLERLKREVRDGTVEGASLR